METEITKNMNIVIEVREEYVVKDERERERLEQLAAQILTPDQAAKNTL